MVRRIFSLTLEGYGPYQIACKSVSYTHLDKGVTQPAIVRPREDGGYEIVSGHRRQKASELAGYADMPCICLLYTSRCV